MIPEHPFSKRRLTIAVHELSANRQPARSSAVDILLARSLRDVQRSYRVVEGFADCAASLFRSDAEDFESDKTASLSQLQTADRSLVATIPDESDLVSCVAIHAVPEETWQDWISGVYFGTSLFSIEDFTPV